VPAARRGQASAVCARASWYSCMDVRWDLLRLFFSFTVGAWRVRGINVFGFFLDSLNLIFFSFVGLPLLLLY